MEPHIQYAKTKDEVSIAYWRLGDGMPLICMPPVPFSHIQAEWQDPEIRAWYQRLAERRSLVRYDGRGTGLSQRDAIDFSLDAQMRDLEAVVNRLDLDAFTLFAPFYAGPVAIAYAVRQPERIFPSDPMALLRQGFRLSPVDADARPTSASGGRLGVVHRNAGPCPAGLVLGREAAVAGGAIGGALAGPARAAVGSIAEGTAGAIGCSWIEKKFGQAAAAATYLQIINSNCSKGRKATAIAVNSLNLKVDEPSKRPAKVSGGLSLVKFVGEVALCVGSDQLLNCGSALGPGVALAAGTSPKE